MDIKLFKKSLASKQNFLKEGASDERNANRTLKENSSNARDAAESRIETNKHLAKAGVTLEGAVDSLDSLDDHIYYATEADLLDDKDVRRLKTVQKELLDIISKLKTARI